MPTFVALETDIVRRLQNGGTDANSQKPERARSDGQGTPCRHCLKNVPAGEDMLILAHRPFDTLHAYAETGPIFLCADACERKDPSDVIPEILEAPDYLVKGYSADERIVYGTGEVVATDAIPKKASEVFRVPNVAFAHVRSARNNCYLARIERD
ncbi:DUF1203 domain-containing protein [Roseobacter sp. EG26]|uniref:DUF1203 domain-containing protein n=1 Tax=Roseobacter sp. EG26 TaxID=3412477 RepID=UPI003CE4AEEE